MTVQYPGFEHERRIHDLRVGPGFELVPLLEDPPPQHIDAVSYATDLVDRLGRDHAPVGVVVAWCMASTIGLEVARLLGDRRGSPPVLVALDGAPCTAAHVADAYQQAIGRYSRDGRPGQVTFTTQQLRTGPRDVIAAMRAELTRYATTALLKDPRQADLVAPIVEEVVGVSTDWLIHLVAAHNAAHAPWDGDVVVVTSTQTPFPGAWPGIAQPRIVPVDCGADDLVAAAEVADLIAACLSARTAGRT